MFSVQADALKLQGGPQQPITYALTTLPPLGLALTFPGLFLSALDSAGAYGVMTLFGLLPAAMAWRIRYVPGVGGAGAGVLVKSELVEVGVSGGALGDGANLSSGQMTQRADLPASDADEGSVMADAVPGGKLSLLAVGAVAAGVILNAVSASLVPNHV